MNAQDVIESYVRDVAEGLPRNKRNDVAFELRALLADELAAKAQEEGRAPDKAMAMALLKGFGRPAETARRYHEPSAVIEPSDTHHFIIWALGGAVALGVLAILGEPLDDSFLKWLGILVIVFAVAGWWRRRRNPEVFGWKPKPGPDYVPRWASALALVMTLIFPVFMYAAPQTFLRIAFFDAFPPSVVELTPAFVDSPQRTATLILLIASAGLYAAELVQGGYKTWSRWATIAVSTGLAGLFLMHAGPMTLDGGATFKPFVLEAANVIATPYWGALGVLFILAVLYQLYQEWARLRPAPALKT